VSGLEALVGRPSSELRARYADGHAPEPSWLPERLRGRLLAFPAPTLLAPLIRPGVAVYSRLGPWEGKSFSPDRDRGDNRVLGRGALPFTCRQDRSVLDDRPTLRLDYLRPRVLFDELRVIGPELAIGPACVTGPLGPHVVFWFGLDRL
jgi:hypothetical protein